MNGYLTALRKYAVFSGRSRRREYWGFILFYVLLVVVLALIDAALGTSAEPAEPGILSSIFVLAMLIPSFSVGVRRLHDTGRSGWWMLLSFVPLIGTIVLLVFTLQDSEPGENRYGPNPKAGV